MLKEQALTYLTVEPVNKAEACVIWLHGLGANGYDFVDIVPSLQLSVHHGIRFIFPHAPQRPVTLNANMVMPAWFDIYGLDLNAKIDEAGIQFASKSIHRLIEQQIQNGIVPERILLVGFSQGGALALYTALFLDKCLGGVAGLSTYLPLSFISNLKSEDLFLKLPVFLAHGLMDPVVPYWMGHQSVVCLKDLGFKPVWHSYPIAHTVCLPECHALGQWMTYILYK